MNWKKITPETEFDKEKNYLFCARESLHYKHSVINDCEITTVDIYLGKYIKYSDVWQLQEVEFSQEFYSTEKLKEHFTYFWEVTCPEEYKKDF